MAQTGMFAKQVSAFVAESKERMVAARNIAIQKTVEFMQTPVAQGGNLPVLDGYLRSSLVFTTGNLPATTRKPAEGVPYRYSGDGLTLVLATAGLDDQIVAVYTANYAKVANFGGQNRPARQFVGLAGQNWPRFVSEGSSEVQRKAIHNNRADARAGG